MEYIDWYYRRSGCTSCNKAQEFLEQNELKPLTEVNCKKFPLDSKQLRERLSEVDRVVVTRGKKLLELDPKGDQEEILTVAIGRSGNLRAPSVRKGRLLIVGFNHEAYSLLKSL
ncbi:MAG: ArsC family (seleno)protein [Vulcanimicrobiota bacterium]